MVPIRTLSSFALTLLVSSSWIQPAFAEDATAAELLAKLVVAEVNTTVPYDRNLFNHWVDADGNGCDTRAEVLIAESKVKTKTGKTCTILNGKWVSAYDNKNVTKASTLDIDHMVPLKEAWESGAASWTDAERESFANDLGFAGSLIAVSASTNRSKGDKDPANWLPSNKSFTCPYAISWIQVKYRWSLTADLKEVGALAKALSKCPSGKRYEIPELGGITPRESSSPVPTPEPTSSISLDPRYSTCSAAKAAGYGPYRKGIDPEYDWYRDGDGDGVVCE